MSLRVASALNFKQISSISEAPATGETLFYVKGNGRIYSKQVGGQEHRHEPLKAVRVTTTGPITLSGTQTIDGVAVSAGDRVLVRQQGTFVGGNVIDNGIYVVAAGAWTRATDADDATELAGSRVYVQEGSVYAGATFETTFASTDTLGVSAVKFFGTRVEYGGPFNLPYQAAPGHTYFDGSDRRLLIWDGFTWANIKGVQDYSGTAPSSPVTGEIWYDSTNKIEKIYNGTGWEAMSGSGLSQQPDVQIFTAGGTWTKPDGAKYIAYRVQGAGGGGGGTVAAGSGANAKGGGGGEGGYSEGEIDASLVGATETITVGALGGGGAATGNAGSPGGASSFGSIAAANGGSGGAAGASSAAAFAVQGGAGGTATAGDIQAQGSPGGWGFGSGSLGAGGNGSDSRFGSGGQGGVSPTAGNSIAGGAASGYGAGGGGGLSTSAGAAAAGGNGSGGIVIITTHFAYPPGSTTTAHVQASAPTTPSIGEVWQDTDDGNVRIYNGTSFKLASGLDLDWVSTTPTAPTSGLLQFTRFRARRLPAFIGPTGQDSQLQPALFSNRIATIQAINNTTTTTVFGLAVIHLNNATATPTAVASAATNFYTSMVRLREATTTTAGTGAGVRSASAQWMLSSTASKGGLFFVCRFGLNVLSSGSRAFIGMSTTTGALAPGTDPSALLNLFGFGFDAGDSNIQFMHNDGSGVATKVDLGANFAKTASAATYFYEARLYAPSGGGQSVYYSLHRLNDGVVVNGGPVTTNLPAVDTLLSFHVHLSNGAVAAAHSIDIQSVYVETDN